MGLELLINQQQLVDEAKKLLRQRICPYMRTQCSQDECLAYQLSVEMTPEEKTEPIRDKVHAFTRDVAVPTGRVLSVGIARCKLELFQNLLIDANLMDGYTYNKEKDVVVGPNGEELSLIGGAM